MGQRTRLLLAGACEGDLQYEPSGGRWAGVTLSWSSPGTRQLLGGDTTWWCEHLSYPTGVSALLDALTRAEASTVRRAVTRIEVSLAVPQTSPSPCAAWPSPIEKRALGASTGR